MAYNDFIGSEHFCWLAVALGVWCGAMVVPFRKISLRFRKFRVAVNMVPNEFIIFLFVQGCMETTSLETEDLLHVVLAIVPIIWDLYIGLLFSDFTAFCAFIQLQKTKEVECHPKQRETLLVK